MGPTPISTSMKTYLLFAAVIAFTLAFSFAEEQFSDELMLSEVKAQINEVKKKGATEADCKNLADTTCKEVETERHQDQTVINRLKTGRNCDNLGQGSVRKATSHWQRTKRTHQVWKIRVTKASNAYVSFTSRSFSSLKEGKCGFIFMSRSYLQAKAKAVLREVEAKWNRSKEKASKRKAKEKKAKLAKEQTRKRQAKEKKEKVGAKERIVKAKAQERKAKKKASKEANAKERKSKERSRKARARAKARERKAKENKAKETQGKESKAKLAHEKARKVQKLRELRAKEHNTKSHS